jgi:hypothetical protein
MADLWLPPAPGEPDAERVPGNNAGLYMPFSTWSFLLHTTEGYRLADALSAYKANNSWPHMTLDADREVLWQHVPFNRPARALKNASGGVQTNRYRVIQLEIIGRAAESPGWSQVKLQRIGHLLARVRELCRFRLEAPYPFLGPEAGFLAGPNAKQRMSFAQWYRFDAICGHQHAPENDHWDPGAVNVQAIIRAAQNYKTGGAAAPEEFDPMGMTKHEFQAAIREALGAGGAWDLMELAQASPTMIVRDNGEVYLTDGFKARYMRGTSKADPNGTGELATWQRILGLSKAPEKVDERAFARLVIVDPTGPDDQGAAPAR